MHVLAPSTKEAARLLATYTARRTPNNGGEQEVWSNFHTVVHELPLGMNAHKGLSMQRAQWRWVSALHHMRGMGVDRIPAGVRVGDADAG